MQLSAIGSACCFIEILIALNLNYLRIRLFWIIVEITDILRGYQQSFSEGSELLFIDHLGLRRMCEDIFCDFLHDCSLISSSLKCDSCGRYTCTLLFYGIMEMLDV